MQFTQKQTVRDEYDSLIFCIMLKYPLTNYKYVNAIITLQKYVTNFWTSRTG